MGDHPHHLPQLRLPESVYFITYRLDARGDKLSPAERDIVAANLEHFNKQRYRLAGYVVMDDHVHVMLQPFSGHELGKILHSWKSYTAKAINRLRNISGKRWMKDNRTEIMRDEREIRAKLDYILANPQRRWPGITDYSWVKVFPVL
jgi:REP element-mobilizing transposase RayT